MKILSVDDNAENRHLVEAMLIPNGYTVISTKNGIEALNLLRQESFDVIVSDLLMPKMDGFQPLRECKKDPKLHPIPFIIYTATYTGKKDIEFGLSLGAARYIIKPIEPEAFLAMLKDVLDGIAKGTLPEAVPKITGDAAYTVEHIKILTEKMEKKIKALETSQEQYRLLADNVSDVIWLLDVATERFIYVSPSVFALRGYTPEEVMAQPMSAAVTPEAYQIFAGNLPDQIARFEAGDDTLRVQRHDIDQPRKDGTFIPTEVVTTFLSGPDRHVTRILGVTRDITKRKIAEASLLKKTEELDRFFTINLDLLCIADTDGVFHRLNRQWESTLGYPLEDLEGKKFLDFVHPDDIPATLAAVQALFGKTDVINFVNRYRCRDGTYRWIEWRSTTSDGKLIYAAARDITERKRAEQELRLSEELFSNAFHVGPAGMTITRVSDGKFIDANESFLRMFEFSREEVIGHTSIEVNMLTPEARVKLIQQQIESGGVHDLELLARSRSGRLINLLLSSKPMEINSEPHHITTMIDITERKLAEEKVKLANRKLALMTDVTYQDIQNKVTALRGYIALSKETGTVPDGESFIDKEEQILVDIHNLINNTKEYQQMGIDQARWIPLEEVIRTQVAFAIQKPGISLEMDLNGLEVYADPLIERVVFNLVENAVTHGKTTTRISLSCRETPKGLVITCEDNGVGIPNEQKARIFERVVSGGGHFMMFFIREIIDLSGMTITENGVPGKGARFEITVPKGMWRFTVTGAPAEGNR
ncbi:MAG: PAS domain S-box protein [Methanoregula sp.]|nr:PAS domain S-box protein [Methanoregula sp.]